MSTRIFRMIYAGIFYVPSNFQTWLFAVPFAYSWIMRGGWRGYKEAPILPKHLGRFAQGGPTQYSGDIMGLFKYQIDNSTKSIPFCGRPLIVKEDWTEDRNASTVMTDSAYVTLKYLAKIWDCGKSFEAFAPEGRKARIMDLGAGIGAVGMGIKQMLPDHEVHMTDWEYQGGSMVKKQRIDPFELERERKMEKMGIPKKKQGVVYETLKAGLAANGLEDKINVTQLWWHDSYELSLNPDLYGTYDHIIVADCIYSMAQIENLARMLIRLSHEGTHIWITGRQRLDKFANFISLFWTSTSDRDAVGGWMRFRKATDKYFDEQDIDWKRQLGEEEANFVVDNLDVIQGHFYPFYPPWKYLWWGSEKFWFPMKKDLEFIHLERNSKQIFEEYDERFGMKLEDDDAELGDLGEIDEDRDEEEIARLRAEIAAKSKAIKKQEPGPKDLFEDEPGSMGKTAHELG